MIAKASKFLPANITPEEVIKGSMFIISAIMKAIPARLDTMIVISDVSDIGWANFDRSHATLRLAFGQTMPERFHRAYILNYGYIFSAISTIMWPLIPARVKEKIRMCEPAALLEDFDAD